MAATTSMETSSGCSKTAAALGESLCCGICYELLLDPVVGSCGHDFCKGCLDMWRSQQRQQGNNRVKCPVCRGPFAESFDKLGVCVRLRDMVELLFPDRIAARRAELERQAALQKKRSVERLQQEDIPVPAAALGELADAQGRRRLHARRYRRQQPQPGVDPAAAAAASAAAAAAGGALGAAMFSGFAAAAAAAGGSQFAGQGAQMPAGMQAAAGGPAGFATHSMLQLQAAMSAAASHLQQLVHTGGQQQQLQQQVVWPMRDVQFTMGWFEPRSFGGRVAGRSSIRSSGRRRRR